MDMYEARQNKEKVSRRIDGDGMTRQRIKINGNPIQMERTQKMEITPMNQMYESCPGTQNWKRCIHAEIVVPPNVTPYSGTGTSGVAPWKGVLFDAGYGTNARAATRLHVINSNFGGIGDNDGGNLHPGSQRLNKNHLTYAEEHFKTWLRDDEYDNSTLSYSCSFDFPGTKKDNWYADPVIKCIMIAEGGKNDFFDVIVPQGDGMYYDGNMYAPTDPADMDSCDDD